MQTSRPATNHCPYNSLPIIEIAIPTAENLYPGLHSKNISSIVRHLNKAPSLFQSCGEVSSG